MRTLVNYIKPFVPRMLWGLCIKVFGTFMDLGLPWVLAYILDEVIPLQNVSFIILWGVVMLLMSVGARMGNIIANRKASLVARDVTQVIRDDLFDKILSLSSHQTDKYTIPTLISRMTTDTYNIHSMIGMMQRLGVRAPIIIVGGIIVTYTLEPVLASILAALLPILIVVVFLISKKGIVLFQKQQKAVDHLVQNLRENITGIRIIKALSKEDNQKEQFDEVNQNLVESEKTAGVLMASINPFMNLALNLGLTLIIIVGAYRVNAGITKPGKIVAFLSYFTMILNTVMAINRIFTVCTKGSASAVRIEEVMKEPEELLVEKASFTPSKENCPVVEFRHVSFAYEGESQPFLQDINLSIQPGEHLGIIGVTGSGKTTLINLLMRFYDCTEGEIRIYGRDIRTYSKQELRKMFGVVFQNDVLFGDTIANNVSFGRELTREQIERAVMDAQAQEFVLEKEHQYDEMLTIKASNLSGGQKQRLMIARALANRPAILVLDDSSSALDYQTDAKLRSAILKNYESTTMIMIAQRISSIRHLTHICVLEEGTIIGYGNHDQLMEQCDIYREIYESQMGGGDNDEV